MAFPYKPVAFLTGANGQSISLSLVAEPAYHSLTISHPIIGSNIN